MFNYGLFKFRTVLDKYGRLVPIESNIDIPFEIKRVYYISKVEEGVIRGYHSHKALHQILICVSGSMKVRLKDGQSEEIVELSESNIGLYIGPMIWREMYDFSPDAVLLVLASEHYNEDDYIRNYDFYLKEVEGRF